MAKIFSFENHIREKKFNEQVIKKVSKLNDFFDFSQDQDDGLAFLHLNRLTLIFFKYIPRGETTTLPTIKQSLEDIREVEPSFSTGGWFVDKVFILNKEEYFKVLPLIYKKEKDENWIQSLKEQIIKLINF